MIRSDQTTSTPSVSPSPVPTSLSILSLTCQDVTANSQRDLLAITETKDCVMVGDVWLQVANPPWLAPNFPSHSTEPPVSSGGGSPSILHTLGQLVTLHHYPCPLEQPDPSPKRYAFLSRMDSKFDCVVSQMYKRASRFSEVAIFCLENLL